MCGTCLGLLLCGVTLAICVIPFGNDWPYNGDGGSFVPHCVTYTIYCVHTNQKLFFESDVVIENVLACAV